MVSMNKIKLNSFDDLFGDNTPSKNEIVEVALTELHEFEGHPFKVVDDNDMEELAESIRLHGVMVPAIVRARETGGYEIISGHRRKRASEIAGKKTMPVYVKEFTDDESVWTMVDSNLQRDHIYPSEKARAYKLKYEAMKHQGIKSGGNTLDKLGVVSNESGKTIQRYIWLARLIDGLLDMVDTKRISFVQAVDLSFLRESEQQWVLVVLQNPRVKVTSAMSKKLKELSSEDVLTEEIVEDVLREPKKTLKAFRIDRKKLADFFPADTEEQEIEAVILNLLKQWNGKQ